MSDSVGQYLNEIGAVALLTADDEKMLSKAIEKGRDAQVVLDGEEKVTAAERRSLRTAVREAEAARDRFIRANLRLVVSIARRYPLPPAMELLDLIQEGISDLSTPSRSSIGEGDSSFQPTQRSGFVNQ